MFATKYHSSSSTPSSPKVYLGVFNSTRHLPHWQALGVPHWRAAHLSEIPYIFNTKHVSRGDNRPEQLELSRRVSSAVVSFAWTGSVDAGNGTGMRGWKRAFDEEGKLGIMVVDGKGEGGGGMVWIDDENGDGDGGEVDGEDDNSNKVQREREEGIRWERLRERCAFINSIAEEIGV